MLADGIQSYHRGNKSVTYGAWHLTNEYLSLLYYSKVRAEIGTRQEATTVAQLQLPYKEVREAAKQLSAEERRRLIEELRRSDGDSGFEGAHDPHDFLGLGAEIWRDPETGELIDAQEYVNQERDSWGE